MVSFTLSAAFMGNQATVDLKGGLSGQFAREKDFDSFTIGNLKHHWIEEGGGELSMFEKGIQQNKSLAED